MKTAGGPSVTEVIRGAEQSPHVPEPNEIKTCPDGFLGEERQCLCFGWENGRQVFYSGRGKEMTKILFICHGSAHKPVVFPCKVAHFRPF